MIMVDPGTDDSSTRLQRKCVAMPGPLNPVTPVRLNLPDPLPLTLTVPAAADLAGIGKNTMWDAVNAGEVPSIRLRGRVLIPTVRFLELFGVEVSE